MAVLEAMASTTPVLITPDYHFPAVESANTGKVISSSLSELDRLVEVYEEGLSIERNDKPSIVQFWSQMEGR